MKFYIFCTGEETANWVKRLPKEWNKVFDSYTLDKKLEYLKNSETKNQENKPIN